MESGTKAYFVIENRIEEIPSLAGKIEMLAEKWKLPVELTMNLNLVIEEALSNIIFYAFTDEKKHDIKITVSVLENNLILQITDDGIAFNPLTHRQPDITLPAEKRPVGGLGILLMSQIMDQMHYERRNECNILTLNKRV